jgi:hypothetical protein
MGLFYTPIEIFIFIDFQTINPLKLFQVEVAPTQDLVLICDCPFACSSNKRRNPLIKPENKFQPALLPCG